MVAANNKETAKKPRGKPFEKGKSGNPKGRPKINEDFRERCRNFMTDKGWANLEKMANDRLDHNHYKANELIAAYAYGKPNQSISGPGEEPIQATVDLSGLTTEELKKIAGIE